MTKPYPAYREREVLQMAAVTSRDDDSNVKCNAASQLFSLFKTIIGT